jgi:hypothetical protein
MAADAKKGQVLEAIRVNSEMLQTLNVPKRPQWCQVIDFNGRPWATRGNHTAKKLCR